MRRRDAIKLIAGAGFAWPIGAHAERRATLGLLAGGTRVSEADRVNALKERLAELGWRQGETLDLVERYADGEASGMAALAAELVSIRPDAILAVGTNETKALMLATTSIPILFLQAADPVGNGLVASLSRPEGNVSGIAPGPIQLVGKRIDLMVQLLNGKARRLAFLVNPKNANSPLQWEAALKVAKSLGIELVRAELRPGDDVASIFRSLVGIDGVVVQFDFLMGSKRAELAQAAIQARLPAIYEIRSYVTAGGLISFGADLRRNFRRGAEYADRLLRGARISELPVEQQSAYETVVNLAAAKAIGLTIPPSFLALVDEVIE